MKLNLKLLALILLLALSAYFVKAECCANPNQQFFCLASYSGTIESCCPASGYTNIGPSNQEECRNLYYSETISCLAYSQCEAGCCCTQNPKERAAISECPKDKFHAGKKCSEVCAQETPGSAQTNHFTNQQLSPDFNTIHTGPAKCDNKSEARDHNDIAIDSGWMHLFSRDNTSIFVIAHNDCKSENNACPQGFFKKGSIHTGPGVCNDDAIEATDYTGKTIDSGWVTLCSNDDSALLANAFNDCTQASGSCPQGYTSKGKIHTGPGICNDGQAEAVDYTDRQLDSGWVSLCVKNSETKLEITRNDCETGIRFSIRSASPDIGNACANNGEITSDQNNHDVLCYQDQNGMYTYTCTPDNYGSVYSIKNKEGFDVLCTKSLLHPESEWNSYVECDTDHLIEKTGNGEAVEHGKTTPDKKFICLENQGFESWVKCGGEAPKPNGGHIINTEHLTSRGVNYYCCEQKWQETPCAIEQTEEGSCGSKCSEEPLLPEGTSKVTFCSRPLTVPFEHLNIVDRSRQNIQKHQNKKDNRYFVYITKEGNEPLKLKVKNLDEVSLERISGELQQDDKTFTIKSNAAFVLHGNPETKTPILDMCLTNCDEKNIELKAEGGKAVFYPIEECHTLVSTISHAYAESSEVSALQKSLSLASINSIYALGAVALYQAAPKELDTGTDTIKIRLKVDLIGNTGEFKEGQKYGGAIYSEGKDVQVALDYARSLQGLPLDEKIRRINLWFYENGVYPTQEVVTQLRTEKDARGLPNPYYDPAMAEFGEKFTKMAGEGFNEPETLDMVVGTKLKDGRFLCVCRNAALLGSAMAREAGVEAVYQSGDAGGPHAWISYLDDTGLAPRVITWDPTDALANDLFEKSSPIPQTSKTNPRRFRQYWIGAPDPSGYFDNQVTVTDVNGKILSSRKNAFGLELWIEHTESPVVYYDVVVKKNPTTSQFFGYRVPSMNIGDTKMGTTKANHKRVNLIDASEPFILFTDDDMQLGKPERFAPEYVEAVRLYNEDLDGFSSSSTADDSLIKQRSYAVERLGSILHDTTLVPPESSPGELEDYQKEYLREPIEEIKKLSQQIEEQERVASVAFKTLDSAENSPLKGRMASIEKLKENPVLAENRGIPLKSISAVSTIVLAFGTQLEDYGNQIDNAYMVTAAKTINVANTGTLAITAGLTVKTIVTAGITGGTAGVVGATAGTASSLGVGFVVGSITSSVGTTTYCVLNPRSSLCGCTNSDEYGGKTVLEMERYTIKTGEAVKYRLIGFQNCPTHYGVEAIFGVTNLASVNNKPYLAVQTGNIFSGGFTPISDFCDWQPSGRWCLGSIKTDLQPGTYKIVIAYWDNFDNRYVYGPTKKELIVTS